MRSIPFLVVPVAMALGLTISACGSTPDAAPPKNASPEVAAGFALVTQKGCVACHSVDGASRTGPTFKGLAGSSVSLTEGGDVNVDDEYLRRAITRPDAEIRKGYPKAVMAAAVGRGEPLSVEQVDQLVAYIKTLK